MLFPDGNFFVTGRSAGAEKTSATRARGTPAACSVFAMIKTLVVATMPNDVPTHFGARLGRSSQPAGVCYQRREFRLIKAKALRVAAKTRPALTGPARDGSEIWRSGWKNARGAGRTKEWTQRSEGLMFAEQVELPAVVVTFWRDGLVVTAYLGEVARLQLQGDLHQRVRNVSGGFIGDGVFGRLGCALRPSR
jgi:hypothetical protein